jgi:DNA-binding GntR family transcriptional regulator
MAFALPVRTRQASPRDTARRAVQVLRDEGLVVTVPQRGAYVVDR